MGYRGGPLDTENGANAGVAYIIDTLAMEIHRLTDRHPAYRKAIRWIVGRKALHRTTQYLNNRTEQSYRPMKQRYYPMPGFKRFESASRSCTAFDELWNYLRDRPNRDKQTTLADRRQIFRTNWSALMAELSA